MSVLLDLLGVVGGGGLGGRSSELLDTIKRGGEFGGARSCGLEGQGATVNLRAAPGGGARAENLEIGRRRFCALKRQRNTR
jgi:hypothetical protein